MSQTVVNVRFPSARTRLVPQATWFLALLLMGLMAPTFGQNTTYSYTKTDTIRAIQRLFDQKRMGGEITTAVGIPVSLVGAGAGLFSSALVAVINLGKTKRSILPITLLSSSIGLVPAGFGVGRLIRYSRRREDRLIDAYESGEPLPAFVRRKLRPRYFDVLADTPQKALLSGR